MKADKLQRLTTAHGRTAQPKAPRTPKTAAAAALEPNKDLDNHATQERIRNPEGCDVQLSYATLHLYPPSIAMRRRVYGFCSRIIADAGSTLAPNQSIYAMRLVAIINERPDVEATLLRYTAYLCAQPGAIEADNAIELATEIGENATADDLAILFNHLCEAAEIRKSGDQPSKN
jgi:hypothetical protein